MPKPLSCFSAYCARHLAPVGNYSTVTECVYSNNLTPGSLLTPAKWAISLERQDRYGFFRVHKRGKPHLTQSGGLTPITLDSQTWNPGDPIGLLLEDNLEDILLDIEGQHLRFQKDNAFEGLETCHCRKALGFVGGGRYSSRSGTTPNSVRSTGSWPIGNSFIYWRKERPGDHLS